MTEIKASTSRIFEVSVSLSQYKRLIQDYPRPKSHLKREYYFCSFSEFSFLISLPFILEVSTGQSSSQDAGKILHRATTSVHVCWHRSSTFSMSDILRANEVRPFQDFIYLINSLICLNWCLFNYLFLSSIKQVAIYSENSRTVMGGRSFGWSSLNSAFSSTKAIKIPSRWLVCLF